MVEHFQIDTFFNNFRRYESKQESPASSCSTSTTQDTEAVTPATDILTQQDQQAQRRAVLLEATVRRLDLNNTN